MSPLAWTAAIVVAGAAALAASAYRPDISPAQLKRRYAQPTDEFVALERGLVVHVRDTGPRPGAPTLVLLHGSNMSLQTWDGWTETLSRQYRVVSLDLPGHGLTGPHPRGDYSAEAFIAVVDGVAEAKGLDRFVLAGNSMGGWISWRYALARPERLSGLVLVDAGGGPLREADGGQAPLGFRIASTPGLRRVMTWATPGWMAERSLRALVSVQSAVTPGLIRRTAELMRHPGNRAAMLDRFALTGGHKNQDPAFARLAALRVPTLVLWGAEDPLYPAAVGARFAAAIPGARLVTLPEVGHLPMEEAPAVSARVVGAFVEALGGSRGAGQDSAATGGGFDGQSGKSKAAGRAGQPA